MNTLEPFNHITTFILDMDGVLTDGTLLLLPDGTMARRMNIKDGYALQLAVKQGYHVVVISGGDSAEAEKRLLKLGVTNIFMNVADKEKVLTDFMNKHGLYKKEVLYMGDDIPDLKVMHHAGLACCPVDAAIEIQQASRYVSALKGGEGCVRDVIEKTLKLRGHWDADAGITSR